MDKDTQQKPVMPGASQITVNKKWVGIIVAATVVFTGVMGWMLGVTSTARPLSAEYLKDHPRK